MAVRTEYVGRRTADSTAVSVSVPVVRVEVAVRAVLVAMGSRAVEGHSCQDALVASVLAAQVLGHLADATRLHLLRLLAGGEQDVSTLTAQVRASRSSVSQHLGRLRLAGLVVTRREGRRIVYRVVSAHLGSLVEEAHQFARHVTQQIPHHVD
ncbi:MAG: Transcriptional regulator, ArsR family [uncultured Pseudonocardia sp.]|uniref:Transcriptional regulator, ArsR family n=1 Tax=uncultured Pseudonocardia sp. TaxID=211455 RepID=A0A6J4PTU3_9PSEU|nr:MAG: Transcriptional regulator, ArsR family [uncultured Pseudonocardia sp.]